MFTKYESTRIIENSIRSFSFPFSHTLTYDRLNGVEWLAYSVRTLFRDGDSKVDGLIWRAITEIKM